MGVVIIILVVTGENKVNTYFDQLKLGQVCNFGVEFDKNDFFGRYDFLRRMVRLE